MLRSLFNALVAAALATAGLGACASSGQFIPISAYQPSAPPERSIKQVVGPGDLLSVQVWNAAQMNTKQRVREDGTVSLFFVDDLRVAGLGTQEIAQEIARRLEGILVAPRVSVVLEESAASTINVTGEVVRPGVYPIKNNPTVLEAISMASGLTQYARRDRIYVLRVDPVRVRFRVTYDELTRGEDVARGFRLKAGDAVIVE